MIRENQLNTRAADTLAHAYCVARAWAATIVLIMLDKLDLPFHEEGFRIPVPSQCCDFIKKKLQQLKNNVS